MSEVIFSWPIASFYGWGIRGLGYALNWPGPAVSSVSEFGAELPPGDPRLQLLQQRKFQGEEFQKRILAPALSSVQLPDVPVLVPLGNDLRCGTVANGKWLKGTPTIACPVFEDIDSVKANIERLKEYDFVVCASRWNRDVLEELGIEAGLCHEGIDPLIFHPGVRQKRGDGRFRVFSGGKAEWRKGQDLVIEAFRIFAQTHDDAVLVASWGSPWGASALSFEGKWAHGSPPGIHIGMPNYVAWAQRAGIKPHQFEFVPVRANWKMAEVYGSCDVAVFPNRCEGGTNFVAMECTACGLPTFVRLAFGQDDLCGTGESMNCIGDDKDTLDRVVDWLEEAYEGGVFSPSEPGTYWTWERHCREMAGIVANV